MAEINGNNHPVLNMVLLAGAALTGIASNSVTTDDLVFYDMVLSMILKSVSILSFLVVLMLNFQKLVKMVYGWFSKK